MTELYARRFPVKVEGRKQPIGYLFTRSRGRTLAVIGHYETDCGGCDTITSMDDIYERAYAGWLAKMDVLYEGLLISADANRAADLWQRTNDLEVIALNTPLEHCLASVNERRRNAYERAVAAGRQVKAKGDVNPKNTESKFKGVQSSLKRLQEAGVPCFSLSREQAFQHIVERFGL